MTTTTFAADPRVFANGQLGPRLVRKCCVLRVRVRTPLIDRDAAERLALTARSIHRRLKVSRTIADLDGAPEIGERHLAEGLQYCVPRTGVAAPRVGNPAGDRSAADWAHRGLQSSYGRV